MYRKILLLSAVIVSAVSCLNNSKFESSGTVWASFEFVGAGNDLFGSDSLYFDTVNKQGFVWDCLAFYHSVSEDDKFQGGFLVSQLYKTEAETDSLANNEYRVNCAAPKIGSNTYAVFVQNPDPTKMPARDITFMLKEYGSCSMQSCFVNNTVAVTEAVNQKFEVGDKLRLKAKGWKDEKLVGEAEIILAEKDSDKDSIICKWTSFDLSKLADVDKVDFEIVAPAGKDIPAAVCIDDMMASVSLSY